MKGFLVATLLMASACTSGESGSVDTTTAVVEVVSSTTSMTVATTSTLSEFQIEQAAVAEAEAEIEAVVVGWYTYPTDTSKGDDGVPLGFTTGRLEQRTRDLVATREAAGEVQMARGGEQIEIRDIRVDLETDEAEVDVCSRGDNVLIDAETGEQIAADDGDSWEGQAGLILVDGRWLIQDWFSDEARGGNECVLDS